MKVNPPTRVFYDTQIRLSLYHAGLLQQYSREKAARTGEPVSLLDAFAETSLLGLDHWTLKRHQEQ